MPDKPSNTYELKAEISIAQELDLTEDEINQLRGEFENKILGVLQNKVGQGVSVEVLSITFPLVGPDEP
jgi:hypothetical protein